MLKLRYQIRYHQYMCHPETCCHDSHPRYWVYDMFTKECIDRFETLELAEEWCVGTDYQYEVKY